MSIIRLLLLVTLPCCCLSYAQAADVDQLLGQMTLDEKLALLHGMRDPEPDVGFDSAGYLPGVPRLGIPPLRLTDGPAGIRTLATATALPAPVALAASFDRDLARRYGEVLGMEGLARNQQVLLSPMVNMVRVPQAGRNFETLGEDPLLAGELVAAEISGIQSQGMMATVKHYAANNQEQDRLTIDASIAERSLRELYLPAFEAAVKAGVASVMCAYNQVNGEYGCENSYLLRVLRQEWNFQGFVMTDWWAMHSLEAIKRGLNLEMPGWAHPEYPVEIHFDEPLRKAVNNHSIPMTTVDAAVRPLLLMMNRFGLLDGNVRPPVSREQDNHATALQVALAGAVLLKNTNATLPLAPAELDNSVLFGPTAAITLVGGGGSSRVLPSASDNTLAMLQQLGNGGKPQWFAGYDIEGSVIPASALLQPNRRTQGLRYVDSVSKEWGVPLVDYTGANAVRGAGLQTWDGELVAPETGSYDLFVQTDGPTVSLFHDDERVLFNDGGVPSDAMLMPTRGGLRNARLTLPLSKGEHYQFKVQTWTGDDKPIQVRLAWLTPSQRAANIDAAVAAAAKAANVIVFAHVEGSEGHDHDTLALPGYQNELITALATRTTARISVVLNTGAPVVMPWADDVSAILQMWYPGQAGGEATARLLLGLDNPSGKLPVSFPVSEDDTPAAEAPVRYPGVDGHQQYDEGILIGYRWYDSQQIKPLFAFGHGLSYTSFDYSDFAVTAIGDDITASVTVRNSGARAGSETAQFYLEHGDTAGVLTEVRKLVGFAKMTLAPGESRRVTIRIPARNLAYWNEVTHQWQPLPGAKKLKVGASSRDLRRQADFVYSPPG